MQQNKQILIDAVVHAVNEDYAEMANDFTRLGFLASGTDVSPIVPALEAIWQNSAGKGLADFNFRSVTGKADICFTFYLSLRSGCLLAFFFMLYISIFFFNAWLSEVGVIDHYSCILLRRHSFWCPLLLEIFLIIFLLLIMRA